MQAEGLEGLQKPVPELDLGRLAGAKTPQITHPPPPQATTGMRSGLWR